MLKKDDPQIIANSISKDKIADLAPLNQIKVLSFKEKNEWTLESKYNIGRKKQEP